MSYKERYNKFSLYHELLVNRYILSTLSINVYNLLEATRTKEKMIEKLLDDRDVRKIKALDNQIDTVDFNYFSITIKQYNGLLNTYGAEIVSNACVILDKYIQNLGHSLKDPYSKLKEWAINLAMKEKLSDYTSTITQAITDVDYHIIEDKSMALKYIFGVPSYLRNVDEGVIYLKKKFNIGG